MLAPARLYTCTHAGADNVMLLHSLSTCPAYGWVQSRFGLVPLVSLINKHEGKPLYSLGGAAVALASRDDLQTLKDIKNQRVSACTRSLSSPLPELHHV